MGYLREIDQPSPFFGPADRIIRAEYGDSRNLMTPTVLERGIVGTWAHQEGGTVHRAFELSRGRGMDGESLYGVAIVDWNSRTCQTQRMRTLSDVFGSLAAAERHLERLREILASYEPKSDEGESD